MRDAQYAFLHAVDRDPERRGDLRQAVVKEVVEVLGDEALLEGGAVVAVGPRARAGAAAGDLALPELVLLAMELEQEALLDGARPDPGGVERTYELERRLDLLGRHGAERVLVFVLVLVAALGLGHDFGLRLGGSVGSIAAVSRVSLLLLGLAAREYLLGRQEEVAVVVEFEGDHERDLPDALWDVGEADLLGHELLDRHRARGGVLHRAQLRVLLAARGAPRAHRVERVLPLLVPGHLVELREVALGVALREVRRVGIDLDFLLDDLEHGVLGELGVDLLLERHYRKLQHLDGLDHLRRHLEALLETLVEP